MRRLRALAARALPRPPCAPWRSPLPAWRPSRAFTTEITAAAPSAADTDVDVARVRRVVMEGDDLKRAYYEVLSLPGPLQCKHAILVMTVLERLVAEAAEAGAVAAPAPSPMPTGSGLGLLSAARRGPVDMAYALYTTALAHSVPLDISCMNGLIRCVGLAPAAPLVSIPPAWLTNPLFVKSPPLFLALEVYQEALSRGLRPNVDTFTSLIDVFIAAGRPEDCLPFARKLHETFTIPSPTFAKLMACMSNANPKSRRASQMFTFLESTLENELDVSMSILEQFERPDHPHALPPIRHVQGDRVLSIQPVLFPLTSVARPPQQFPGPDSDDDGVESGSEVEYEAVASEDSDDSDEDVEMGGRVRRGPVGAAARSASSSSFPAAHAWVRSFLPRDVALTPRPRRDAASPARRARRAAEPAAAGHMTSPCRPPRRARRAATKAAVSRLPPPPAPSVVLSDMRDGGVDDSRQ